MRNLYIGISFAVAYACALALGAIIFPVEAAEFSISLRTLLPIHILAVVCVIVMVIRSGGWAVNGFGSLSWSGLVWMLPSIVVLCAMGISLVQAGPMGLLDLIRPPALMWLLAVTFLIAFGEEVVFRGLLLRRVLATGHVLLALAVSAVAFGLFHGLNILLGHVVGNVLNQMAFAAMVGVFLAPVALRVGNLWPLILWHWMWNITVFLSREVDLLHPFVLAGMALQAVICLWLWAQLARDLQSRRP